MINKLGAALVLVAFSGLVGCGRGTETNVVGSEEEYAKIRTSPEKVAEMNGKMNAGPSPAEIKAMAEAAKKSAAGN